MLDQGPGTPGQRWPARRGGVQSTHMPAELARDVVVAAATPPRRPVAEVPRTAAPDLAMASR